jgi:hypothetical protein
MGCIFPASPRIEPISWNKGLVLTNVGRLPVGWAGRKQNRSKIERVSPNVQTLELESRPSLLMTMTGIQAECFS